MKTKTGVMLWFATALLIISAIVGLQRHNKLNIDSNILNLLPPTESNPGINAAFESFSEMSMRRFVILVENPDMAKAKLHAEELAASLRDSAWVEEVDLGVSPEEQSNIGQFNFAYRYHLLTQLDAQLLASGEYETFVDDAISRIFSPLTGALAALLPTDPFLLSYRLGSAAREVGDNQSFVLDDGYLTISKGMQHYVLLTSRLSVSPFDQTLQQDVLRRIKEVEETLANTIDGSRIIRTGALFYTADGYQSASREISLFGGTSLLLVLSLMLVTFRSPTPILLIVCTLGFGICAGFLAVRLVFGSVHLMTFIFGASLIGVAVDYALHYFVQKVDGEEKSRLKRIFPAITLGLLSSVIGYLALMTTPFPGLQQMALFSMVGLTGSYATVVLMFPVMNISTEPSPKLLGICNRLIKIGSSRYARFIWAMALITPLVAIIVILTEGSPENDIRQFQSRSQALEEQENEIQNIMKSTASNQFYLVRGETSEKLLQNMESVSAEVESLVDSGAITGYMSLSPWLQSIRQQEDNYQLLSKLFNSGAAEKLVETGLLSYEELASSRVGFRDKQEDYLLPQVWLDSPVGQQFSYLWIGEVGTHHFAIIALRGVEEPERLTNLGEDVIFVDQVDTVSDLLLTYRQSAGMLLAVAIGLIWVLLSFRYGLIKAAMLMSSPVIAISVTVIVFAMLGEALNLFNVLALFLVIGVGIDFGVFFAETQNPNARTCLAVLLSSLTTIFSFGMLSLSSTSVIESFGLSMLIGITTVLFLSPITGHLATCESLSDDATHV